MLDKLDTPTASYTPLGQQHHVIVCWYDPDWIEDNDFSWDLWCPFGESHLLVSDYPTVQDVWPGISRSSRRVLPAEIGWPAEIGHAVKGYCTMGPYIRPIYKWRTEGAILEAQVIGTSGCYLGYEVEQMGLADMLVDAHEYDLSQPGAYEVELWTDGYGEDYCAGLEVRLGPVHPDVLAEIGWPLESRADSADFTCLTPTGRSVHVAQD